MVGTAVAVALRTVACPMVGEGRHRWLRLHQQQHQCARATPVESGKASLLRTRAAFCMQRRPRRRLHAVDLAAEGPPPSLPCPDARSVCGSAVSLPACLPRSLFAFVRARALAICPELLACCARSDCTAPCRGAGTPLLAAEAHTSATTADLSAPPPHPSPPLCSRQESSRHTGAASMARACPAARAASLSLAVAKVHWWRYEAPE